jgi:uncharacterized protein (TIGR02246 family)
METTGHDDAVAAIRELVAASEALQGDVEGFSGLLARDVVLVNVAGRRVLGRETFRGAMREAMQSHLARVLTTTELVDMRFVRDDVAIVSCTKRIHNGNDVAGGLPAQGMLTYVFAREGAAWRIVLAQTTPAAVA